MRTLQLQRNPRPQHTWTQPLALPLSASDPADNTVDVELNVPIPLTRSVSVSRMRARSVSSTGASVYVPIQDTATGEDKQRRKMPKSSSSPSMQLDHRSNVELSSKPAVVVRSPLSGAVTSAKVRCASCFTYMSYVYQSGHVYCVTGVRQGKK